MRDLNTSGTRSRSAIPCVQHPASCHPTTTPTPTAHAHRLPHAQTAAAATTNHHHRRQPGHCGAARRARASLRFARHTARFGGVGGACLCSEDGQIHSVHALDRQRNTAHLHRRKGTPLRRCGRIAGCRRRITCHICTRTGPTPPDTCTRTGPAAPTSAAGLGRCRSVRMPSLRCRARGTGTGSRPPPRGRSD